MHSLGHMAHVAGHLGQPFELLGGEDRFDGSRCRPHADGHSIVPLEHLLGGGPNSGRVGPRALECFTQLLEQHGGCYHRSLTDRAHGGLQPF